MKKIIILTLILGIVQQSLFAQIGNVQRFDFNKINIGDNFDFGDFIIFNNNGNNCCEEESLEDISFGYDIGAALTASALIQQARERPLNQWFDRQHTVLKEEIEKQLGESFSNYNDARNTYFKYHEKIGIHKNHKPIESKYNARRLDKENKQAVSLKNLKLLRLRENEIKAGNINNSSYGNFTYNGTSLDQIQSLSQLKHMWSNEVHFFSDNNWKYKNDRYLYYTVKNLGGLQNYNHEIFTDLFNKQLTFYNRYDRWKQLDLMQSFLNEIRPPLALPPGYITPQMYATSQYIEDYAKRKLIGEGITNIFHPYYYQHTTVYQIWLAREGRQEAIERATAYVQGLRDAEINNLLNEVSLEDLIEQQLEENPFLLLDIDCNQIQNWQSLAQHTPPQSVQDKIDNLPSNWANDFEIQPLDEANGTVVNLDYFSVNVTSLPNNPNTGQQLTADGFLDYMRRNFNDFVEGSTFEPYCKNVSPYICQQETDLWNSNNPLGSVIYIDIPGDDGVVVCTEYNNSYWYFMTMNAPYAGNHPVSGTRQFGYEDNSNGSYNFFVRGVDRIDSSVMELIASPLIFGGADDLWTTFQNKTKDFVNNNGGNSSIIDPSIDRVDWDKVQQVLNGELPINELGCN